MKNGLSELLGVDFPIIQGGMVWVSGWRLASAVSECGGLGVIGAGSMKPDLLKEHIQKCRLATSKPFGVNLPLLKGDAAELAGVIVSEGVKTVITSAGSPAKFIDLFKKNNLTVIHAVPSVKLGLKCQTTGCDAVIGEGVEAGGHNGADGLTTFCLIPQLKDALTLPVIAAGGIADGRGIAAALALGADGVQIGTRFAATVESSAHENYKNSIIKAGDTDTVLAMRKIGYIRMLKNEFANKAVEADLRGDDENALYELLDKKREMKGIFEGDLVNGALEAGQGSGLIKNIPTVKELFGNLLEEYFETLKKLK